MHNRRAGRRKYHYIYKTVRTDGKYYIGMHSTDNLEDGYQGSGTYLAKSIKRHGREQHITEILEFLPTREQLRLREREIITQEILNDPMCMNLHLGGNGGWTVDMQRELGRRGKETMDKKNKLVKMGLESAVVCLIAEGLTKIEAEAVFNEAREWFDARGKRISTRAKDAYAKGERTSMGWSAKAGRTASSAEARAKAMETRIKNGTVGHGESNSRFGTKWVCNPDGAKSVNADLVPDYLSQGYKLGRKWKPE